MPYLYKKEDRVVPGNLQNRKYSFLLPPKYSVSHCLTTFFLLSFFLSFFLLLLLLLLLLLSLNQSVEWSELVGEWVRRQLRFSRCELLLLEAGSWGPERVREPRGRGTFAFGSRYRATASKDVIVDTSECVCVCVAVNCNVFKRCMKESNNSYHQSKPRL
jgi:hypothetical protein